MGKASRARWDGNVRSMAIVAKPRDEITAEDIAFLRENYTSTGGLLPNAYAGGAFYTPTHVARFVIEALRGLCGGQFAVGSRWLEPSCGSGVFLEHIPDDAEITALELDDLSAKVTSLIYPHANVIQGDAFTHDRRDYYDFVVGNPPYGVTIDIAADTLPDTFETLRTTKGRAKGKSECAFIELAIKAVKPGGYIAFVLPMGLNYASYAENVRRLLYETCWHVATIMLPGETFALTGTTIPTQILIVRKAPPGTPLIPSAEKRWGSKFKRSDYGDITQFDAKFLAGQTPAYFAQITDIGYDAKGKPTPSKWNDGLTQLDELLDDFTDDYLTRSNLYPHIPSWHSVKDVSAFMFSHGNGSCDGYRYASYTYSDGPYRWNELTLGAGEEVEWNGEEVSTFDFAWQDRIVADYYAELTEETGSLPSITPEMEAA
ncbi:class I SAM-dependent DNA methyltransferase [uncultured Paenibacillus sp.]|uniref:HsdM family class I SAM-dependent methyltransferase n=1 Tax=uncultured Paenibacillus sp. TaxID=227322 RepID=UPI0015AF3090|nr:N-6 DNA methylase [uncultured Paenibacillus sp.]DAW22580.1 MAG TPA: N-6 DNA Methylase [Caudoviricetes sp.]